MKIKMSQVSFECMYFSTFCIITFFNRCSEEINARENYRVFRNTLDLQFICFQSMMSQINMPRWTASLAITFVSGNDARSDPNVGSLNFLACEPRCIAAMTKYF